MNWFFKPSTDIGKRAAGAYGNFINPPNEEGNRFKGLMHGMAEGAGGLADDMTSPFSLLMSLAGAPWLKGAMRGGKALSGIGRTAEGMSSIPRATLPAQLIERGGEAGYNISRAAEMAKDAVRLEDIAHEGSKAAGRVRMPVDGGIDVAQMMADLNKARGKK